MNARRKIGTTTAQEKQSMTHRKIGALALVAAIGLVSAACTPGTGQGTDATPPADQSPTAPGTSALNRRPCRRLRVSHPLSVLPPANT